MWEFPSGAVVKNSAASHETGAHASLIPGSGRFPGEGNGNPLQYACLGNPTEELGGLPSMGFSKSRTLLKSLNSNNE